MVCAPKSVFCLTRATDLIDDRRIAKSPTIKRHNCLFAAMYRYSYESSPRAFIARNAINKAFSLFRSVIPRMTLCVANSWQSKTLCMPADNIRRLRLQVFFRKRRKPRPDNPVDVHDSCVRIGLGTFHQISEPRRQRRDVLVIDLREVTENNNF